MGIVVRKCKDKEEVFESDTSWETWVK